MLLNNQDVIFSLCYLHYIPYFDNYFFYFNKYKVI